VIEDESRKAGVRRFETLLESLEHLLCASRGRFLQLETVAQPLDLLLQFFLLLLEFGTAAKQLDDAAVFRGRRFSRVGEEPERLQRFHRFSGRETSGRDRCSIPATYLTSYSAPNADPVHAPSCASTSRAS
jgi:hypothetical protein